ncbi:Protein NETWORKED 1D [Camellia lanceoleosa]|uniref:Protein NETWORKED 1D n=1 Tax=Camellia lanceoleosa TaxID=1840588 RepID=A0ACC0FF02_9ERIC|nr:Protein NETWORKED 1D [Camellia lanceoleosa]
MGESPTCLVRSFSKPAGTTSTEPEEGDPYCALTTSVSFRRFMLESLACEKWSCFSNNQYLEEAKKSSKAGLVAQRKAYFEALYKSNGAKKPAALLEEQNAACNEPNVMEETSRDSSNPPRIPTRASANGLSVHSSTAPQEERRRSKPFEDHLILTVEDHVGPNKDEVLGKVIVPLSSVELKVLNEDLDKLQGVNGALEDKLRMTGGNFEEVQLENLHLKEELKISEDALRTVASVSEQLNHEIANGKDQLSQKEIELSEAEHKFTATENEKSELQKTVEDLKRENDEVKMVRDDQEKQILKLSEDNDHLSKENGYLNEANRELEFELHHLHEEHEKTRSREESLFYEVQKGNNEINLWESEATTFFGDLQISTLFQALFEEKVHQLTEACKSLEGETTSKNMDIEKMKERISTLEGENGGLKTQLAAYVPAINALKDCILSLENHTCLHRKLQQSNNEGLKDAELANHSADQKMPDEISELQDLQTRIKAVEKAVIEMESFVTQENINANTKLEAAMRQIEELKFKGGSNQENVRPTSEISELENGLLTKDIMFDQISECSSYGISRRECANANSHMLEFWDIADLDGFIDLTKLTILQIIVQDLKRKVEISEKEKKSKAFDDSDTLKLQLEEAEEAILKLFDLNSKLIESIEDRSFAVDGKPAMDSEESGSISSRRRKISDHARKVSEIIGRLQLEVQKIQFVLLKLDDENEKESKGKMVLTDSKRRVLLSDYLYGGGVRTGHRRKKGAFCACVRPPTRGDSVILHSCLVVETTSDASSKSDYEDSDSSPDFMTMEQSSYQIDPVVEKLMMLISLKIKQFLQG